MKDMKFKKKFPKDKNRHEVNGSFITSILYIQCKSLQMPLSVLIVPLKFLLIYLGDRHRETHTHTRGGEGRWGRRETDKELPSSAPFLKWLQWVKLRQVDSQEPRELNLDLSGD